MASTVTLEGVKKAVFFPLRGEKWGMKLLIGSALSFASYIIPILPIFPIFGYFWRIMHQIIVKDEDPGMPEWNDWGKLFLDGIKVFGVYLIYLLPALILAIGGYVLFFVLDFSLVFSATSAGQYSSNAFPSAMIGSAIGMFVGIAIAMLGLVLIYVTLIFIPPALGNMIEKNDFMAAFHFKEWWPLFKANLSGYAIAIAIALGLFTLMYILAVALYATVILCFLLPFALCLIFFVFGAVSSSLYAIAYRDALRTRTG